MITLNLTRFDHATQRFVLKDIRAPANAFEWRRFVVEDDIRRSNAAYSNYTNKKEHGPKAK